MFLAFDIGLKRIGIAMSPDGKVVFPQDPILRKNRNQAASEVAQRIKDCGPSKIIVGIPRGGSSEEEMERRIKHFVALVNPHLECIYVDEYGTSQEAKEISKGVFRHQKDGKLDSLAAKIILERYLSQK